MKYLIIEPAATGFSAYSPDLPDCVATRPTREACERNMREAVAFHLDGLRAEGEPILHPDTTAAVVEVAACGRNRTPLRLPTPLHLFRPHTPPRPRLTEPT